MTQKCPPPTIESKFPLIFLSCLKLLLQYIERTNLIQAVKCEHLLAFLIRNKIHFYPFSDHTSVLTGIASRDVTNAKVNIKDLLELKKIGKLKRTVTTPTGQNPKSTQTQSCFHGQLFLSFLVYHPIFTYVPS